MNAKIVPFDESLPDGRSKTGRRQPVSADCERAGKAGPWRIDIATRWM